MVFDILTNGSIRIKHDDSTLLLLVTWVGRQTKDSVVEGCWQIHQAMLKYQSFKILNDNRHVVGSWDPAAEWVGKIWLPRMKQDGLQQFGWVQSVLDEPRASTQLTMASSYLKNSFIKQFKDYDKAINWLTDPTPILTG